MKIKLADNTRCVIFPSNGTHNVKAKSLQTPAGSPGRRGKSWRVIQPFAPVRNRGTFVTLVDEPLRNLETPTCHTHQAHHHMKNEIEIIQSLLLEHKRLRKEKLRHLQMADDYRDQEEKLVATVDLQDEEQFKTLSNIRLRLELLPAKIQQFEESAVEVEGEIKGACIAAATSIIADTKVKANLLRTKFRQALSGFFSDERTNDDLAQELFNRTDVGAKLITVEYPCSSTLSITSFDPVERAGKLIEASAALDQIKV